MNEPLEIDRCPTSAELLHALEDEFSSPRAVEAWTHVHRCARCREEQRWFLATLGVIAVADESAPGAHQREIAFHQKLRDQSRRQSRIHVRLARWTRARAVPIAAVTLLFFALSLPYWPSSAALQAEELLDRAVLSEQTRPARWAQKVLVRVTTDARRASMTHATRLATFAAEVEIGEGVTVDLAASAGATPDLDALLVALFARHHLDWRQPLSIAGIRTWRASLKQKRETITAVDAGTLRLRITTDEGELSEVDLVVDTVSYAIMSQTLVFRDVGTVEVSTRGPQEVRLKPVTQTAGSDYKTVGTPIAPPPLVPPVMPEMRPIEPPPLFGGAAIPHGALSRWLETTFGSNERQRAGFVRDLVRRVSAVQRDLYTLQDLSRRTSAATPGAAGAPRGAAADQAQAVRAEMQRQVARQARDLTAHLEALATSMAMFGTTSRALPRAQVPQNWRQRTTEALVVLEQFESQLGELLKQEDVQTARDEHGGLVPHPVSATFGALWDAWHAPREP